MGTIEGSQTRGYGVCRWIISQILPYFDILKFEIGPLEGEKIKFSNPDKITADKFAWKYLL